MPGLRGKQVCGEIGTDSGELRPLGRIGESHLHFDQQLCQYDFFFFLNQGMQFNHLPCAPQGR